MELQPEIKQSIKILSLLVRNHFSYFMMHEHFSVYYSTAMKIFHFPEPAGGKAMAEMLAEVYALRLEESFKQADIKTSFVKYTEGQDKKKKGIADIPRTLAEIVSHFCALLYQERNQSSSFGENLTRTLMMIFDKSRLHFEGVDPGHLLNCFLLALQDQAATES